MCGGLGSDWSACVGLSSDWSVFCVCAAAGVGGSGCQEHAVCLGLEERTGPGHRHRTLRPGNHLHYYMTYEYLGNAWPKGSGVYPECPHLTNWFYVVIIDLTGFNCSNWF